MASCHKSGLSFKVFHFDVKDDVPSDLLIPRKYLLVWSQEPECDMNGFHFFCNGILPQGVSICFINPDCFFHSFWYPNPKFVCSLWYRLLIAAIILSRFFLTYGTHKAKAGSSERSDATE